MSKGIIPHIVSLSSAIAFVVALGVAGFVSQAWALPGHGPIFHKPSGHGFVGRGPLSRPTGSQGSAPTGSVSVPELDGATAGAALVLLLSAGVLVTQRRRKAQLA